ncbi:hypothetical protein ACJX0J_023269, partial [Zea mays]
MSHKEMQSCKKQTIHLLQKANVYLTKFAISVTTHKFKSVYMDVYNLGDMLTYVGYSSPIFMEKWLAHIGLAEEAQIAVIKVTKGIILSWELDAHLIKFRPIFIHAIAFKWTELNSSKRHQS